MSTTPLEIRPTRGADVPGLPAIEAAAGALFRSLPELAWLADEEPISVAEHENFARAGLSWVAVWAGRVAGFLVAEQHGSALHLVELSVHPDLQRRGIGASLLHTGIDTARRRGLPTATLTTFFDVAWNGPFYERHGFEPLTSDELTTDLRRVLMSEAAAGLPMERRGAMRRAVQPLR